MIARPKNVLFVCSGNYCRSPTAEYVFKDVPGLYCRSAGIDESAVSRATYPLLSWADLIICFEDGHEKAIRAQIGELVEVVNVNIPDVFNTYDPILVEELHACVRPYLRRLLER